MIRVFTKVDSRKATEDEINSFTKEAEMASLKGGEIDEKTIQKFPTTDKMKTSKGKKEGDITVFREGNLFLIVRYGSKSIHVERWKMGICWRGYVSRWSWWCWRKKTISR